MNLDLPQIGGECQDFTRWWNSEGQFLQPMGEMDSNFTLEFSKRIAKTVFAEMERRHAETRITLEKEIDIAMRDSRRAEERTKEICIEIESAVAKEGDDREAVAEILSIIKSHR